MPYSIDCRMKEKENNLQCDVKLISSQSALICSRALCELIDSSDTVSERSGTVSERSGDFNSSDTVSERSGTVSERSGDFKFCPTLSQSALGQYQSALETFNLSDAVSERSRTVSERATNSPVKSCTSS
ncbi:hypothetical protein DFH28DRAFT_923403 [Melampsora americana]|nr:hypothetical protein DFH28DRAFT_923403 [Melampsora americana]